MLRSLRFIPIKGGTEPRLSPFSWAFISWYRIQIKSIGDGLEEAVLLIERHSRIHLLFQILPRIILRLQLLPAATRLPRFVRSFLSHSSQHQFIQFECHLPDHIIIKCLGLDISKTQFLIQLFGRCVVLDHIKSQRLLTNFSFLFNYILY